MMMVRSLILALLASSASAAKVTPIQKVTELLKGLQAKVEAEGAKEAAAYDKYACFCKEQADEKLYSIEKSKDKIKGLTAQITSDDAEVSRLTAAISKLARTISGLEDDIEADTSARKTSHDKYLAKAQDLSEAIDSCAAAIQTMKDAKGGLKDAKVNLVQMQSLVEKLAKQAPAKYTFQGNDIIATLEDLLQNFNQMKATMDQDEFDVNSVFEKKTLGNSNEKKFATQEKEENEKLSAAKSEDVMAAREDKDEETKDMNADQNFLDTLTGDCEDKAKLFDQRSSTRSDELTAMTGAIAQLEEGVAGNEGANKKLVGLVQGSLAPSFIQLQHTLQEDGDRAVRKVQSLLQEAAARLHSSVLQGAAARVAVSADHFVKVRTLIKDLISKLKADAKSEAEQKSFCDKAMNKAITQRDDSNSKKEAANAKIATLNSEMEDLTAAIADLADKIAENAKALNEATELRAEDKGENEATVASATEGKTACDLALQILSSFYKTAFVQTKYTPPNSGRDGKTVGDLAPETFDEEYHGAQGESKGIMGIMEVISSDFDRTIKTVERAEKTAQTAFDKFEKTSKDDSKAKSDTSDKKDSRLKDVKSELLDAETDLKDAEQIFSNSEETLDKLKESCVEGEETWEERAAARKKEIEALKEAQRVLDEWQN